MSESQTSRRQFIGVGGSLAAASFWLEPQTIFSQELAKLSKRFESEDDFVKLGKQYSLDSRLVYLNHASIGTMPRPVQSARQKYLESCETNPWLYMWGGAWDEARQQVRKKVARFLGCHSEEVAITHNTTELFNVLAHGLPLKKTDEVLFSSLCHAGASLPFVNHQKHHAAYQVRRFDHPVSKTGELTMEGVLDEYRKQIRPETRLLVLPHLDNTVGLRHPLKALAKMAREKGVEWIAVDAAQTVGMIPVNFAELDIDVIATSPHKWLGAPKGVGIAVVKKSRLKKISPMWTTWGQQRWGNSARKFEDYGTRNLAELLTLGNAIEFAELLNKDIRENRLKALWQFTQKKVDSTDRIQWQSPRKWEMGGSLYSIRVSRPAQKVAEALFKKHRIVVRPFSNMGLNNLRVSPNVFTSKRQIEKFLEVVSS